MIAGWRMFLAGVLLAVYGLCCRLWWVFDSICLFGILHTQEKGAQIQVTA